MTTKQTLLISNAVTLIAAVVFAWLYFTYKCPPCYEAGQTVTVIDTVFVKDSTLKLASTKLPTIKGVKKVNAQANKSNDTIQITLHDTITNSITLNECGVIVYYTDTITSDSIKAVVNDTVTCNRITGRSVYMVNLKPCINTTTTVVRKEKWKVYVGASFMIPQRELQRWGVGGSALLTIPKIGGISYTFDARNFTHIGTFYALIRFKK